MPKKYSGFKPPLALTMTSPTTIDVQALLEDRPLGRYQGMIFALCIACLMVDGFDLQALSFAAPALIHDWKIPSAVMGPVFSAALAGILIGSFLLSMLADKIGRRPVLIGATLWFAVLTYLTGQSTSVHELTLLRFIAGIGLGGIMPNAMALAGEYAPTRRRVVVMMIVSTGFTAGALTAGLIAQWLIPHSGWRAMFICGAGLALLVTAALIVALPESLPFLALKPKPSPSARLWLRRFAPDLAGRQELVLTRRHRAEGVPLAHLFTNRRSRVTLLLWLINFLNLLNLYFLTSWLPTAVREFGFSNGIAIRAGAFVQIGGLIGGLVLGFFAERLGLVRVLIATFISGALSLAAISHPALPVAALLMVALLAGFSISGGQVGVNALTAICYPTELRATGIGASLGIGRVGAILGPAIAGVLLLHHWQPHDLFLAAALPAVLSAVAVFALRGRRAPSGQEQELPATS